MVRCLPSFVVAAGVGLTAALLAACGGDGFPGDPGTRGRVVVIACGP